MGRGDIHKYLLIKKKASVRDITDEFEMSPGHAMRILRGMLKWGEVEEEYRIVDRNGRKFVVSYFKIKE